MLRSIVEWSLKSRFVVLALAAAMMVFGVARLRHVPVDILPEFAPPYVEIQTESLGLSAEEVEQLITVPMEQDLLNGVPWLETIRSESVAGLSSVVLVFEPGTDIMRARQMVSERMTQAVAMPHVSKPPIMLQPLSATSRVMIVGLSSKSLSPIQMSVLARWTIAPRLIGVPGVANVAIWGQRDRQLQVQVDPKRLQEQGISLFKVLETTGNALWVSSLSFVEASTPGTGGFIDTSNQRLGIRHILPIVSPEGLAQVAIEGTDKRLGDVARVVEDHQPLIGDALTKNGPGLLLVIEKFPGANTLEVTHGVEEAMAGLSAGLPGMDIDTNIFRPADFIDAVIHNLGLAVLLGFAFVILVIALFLFDARTAFISLIAVPLSLVAAGLVLHLTGTNFNVIVLTGFAIALGVLVHDGVNDVDHILRRLRQARKEGSTKSAPSLVLEASLEARSSILYAVVILLLAVAPILFVERTSGAFFHPLVLSYGLALLASTLVAMTVTPALSLILLGHRSGERRPSPLAARLQRAYDARLGSLVQRGGPAFVAAGLLAVVGLATLPALHRTLLPAFKERNLQLHLQCVPGTSQPEMSRIAGLVSKDLRAIPGVRDVGAHIGRAVQGDQVVNVNSSEVWISIDPAADYDRTAAAIQSVVEAYPGVHHDVQTYMKQQSSDVLPEPEDNIVVRLYGDTDEVLHEQGENVRKALGGIPGIVGSQIQFPVQQATLETEVDMTAAQRYGLKPGDVRRAAATLLSGIQVGSLFEEQKVFDVVVWSTPETRHNLSNIQNLMIDTPNGGHVRLGEVAKVRIVPSASVIRHEAVKRYIDVVSNVEGRDLDDVAADVKARVQKIQFPFEYHAQVLGQYAVSEAAHARLVAIGIAVIIGIFFVLQAAFTSWRLAALVFAVLPAALAGGLIVALAGGGDFSLGHLAGLLAVLGIALCSKIMLVHRYQHLERHEGEPFGPGLALRGAHERFGPTMMTTLATGLALIPTLLLGDVPGLEILRPMALVILGGLVTSDLVDLFLMPALFAKLGVSSVFETDAFAAKAGAREEMFGGLSEAAGLAGD